MKLAAYQGITKTWIGVLQTMELKNVHYWKCERDDLHILNTVFPSNPEKCQNLSIKTYEGMKHATMRNGECTWMYTLYEGVYYLHF